MKYINRVYRASVLDRAEAFQERGLQGHQISYVRYICDEPGLTHEELSRNLFVHKSSITRQITRLEKAGFIRREVDPSDRRVKRIYPTALAESIYPEIIAYLEKWNEALTHDLAQEEEEALLKWVKLLAKRSTKYITTQNLYGALGLEEEEEKEDA